MSAVNRRPDGLASRCDGCTTSSAPVEARTTAGSVPAARAFISEAVWLLEKVGAVQKFIVFGGEADVPRQWLELWATLCPEDIALFYLDNKGELHEL